MITLRDYQQEGKAAVLRELSAGNSTLVHWATGLGKTVLLASVLAERKGTRSLVFAHRWELLEQCAKTLKLVWPECRIGWIRGKREELEVDVILSTVQTLWHRRERLPKVDLVVVDEAHHITAQTYLDVLQAVGCTNTDPTPILGVTATPRRSDRDPIVGEKAPLSTVADVRDLRWGIENDWLCKLTSIVVHTELDVSLDFRAGDFTPKSMEELDTPERNELIVSQWTEHAKKRPTLVFTAGIDHARRLAEHFTGAGYKAEAIIGETSPDDRAEILARYKSGATRLVTNCQVLTEGFDAPWASCVLLARPVSSKSLGLYAQIVGRGSRIHPGKPDCLILDFADNVGRHDLADLTDLGLDAPKHTTQTGESIETEPSAETEDEFEDTERQLSILDVWAEEVDIWAVSRRKRQRPYVQNAVRVGAGLWALACERGHGTLIIQADRGRYHLIHAPDRKPAYKVITALSFQDINDVIPDTAINCNPLAHWHRLEASDRQLRFMKELGRRVSCTVPDRPMRMGESAAWIGFLKWREQHKTRVNR